MLNIDLKECRLSSKDLHEFKKSTMSIDTNNLDEKVKLLIIRDLLRLNWNIEFTDKKISVTPPKIYNKNTIRNSMAIKRQEIILNNKEWILKHIDLARDNLADGHTVLSSKIEPIVEVCTTQQQHDLFRIFRYYWSSPYSEYVGRRIKLLIRDNGLPNKPIIGIAALGSPIIHIPDRDAWIGWDKETRTKNLIYTMDAYVVGALPPYNFLLGGKLVSYILASNEVREIYKEKYKNTVTKISKRKANDLVCIFTTSLFGRSSQYNRIKFNGELIYKPIGETKGYGTLHLTDETFNAMLELLRSKGIYISSKFGSGPSWRMRVIRAVGDLLNFDSDFLLRHSFRRWIYAVPLATNFREYLTGKDKTINYCDYPLESLVEYWKKRWLENRKMNIEVINKVKTFKREDFNIII